MALYIRDGLTHTDLIPADPAGRWPAIRWAYRPARWEEREEAYGAVKVADRARKVRELVAAKLVSFEYEGGDGAGVPDAAMLADMEPLVFQHLADRVMGYAGPSNGEADRGKGSSAG